MSETGEILIIIFVYRRPPALVLVVLVEVRAHNIERHDGHQTVRHDGTWIADGEIGGSDKGVDLVDIVLCPGAEYGHKSGGEEDMS